MIARKGHGFARRWRAQATALSIMLAGMLSASAALAQQSANRPEDAPGRDIGTAAQGSQAAAESLAILGDAGPPVSYDEVLARPDDAALNYRFALQQAAAGDLRGASTTLERILLLNPNLTQVRLLYAIVLYRLDSVDDAATEFRLVRTMAVTDDVRRAIDKYLADIALRQKTTRYVASLSLGGDFQTNRNAVARSEQVLIGGLPFSVPGGHHDVGRIGIGTFELHHDLKTQERDELLARATGYYDNQVQVKSQDVRAMVFEAGGVMHRDIATFTPTLTFTDVELANHHYLMSPGAKLLTERKLDARTDGYLLLQAEHQRFFDNPVAANALAQTGWRWTAQAGVNYTLNTTMQLGGSFRHAIDRATDSSQAYTTDEIAATHTWLLGRGQFLLTSLSFGLDRYDTPDPTVAALTRVDATTRLRTTYGVPLDTLSAMLGSKPLPDGLGDIVLALTAEGIWAQSTLTNFAYTNYRAQAMFTKRWEF